MRDRKILKCATVSLSYGILMACAPSGLETAPISVEPAVDTIVKDTSMQQLVGVWNVSLYFDPTQPPSSTVMEIIAVEDGRLTGSFYGTPFEIARVVEFEGEIRLSFVTSDGSGPYTSAARLMSDGLLRGQTLSTGRDFLMPWTAQKNKGEE